MSILVDYTCGTCLGRHEARVASPPPAARPCPACGCTATRVWSPVGILRGAPAPVERPAARTAGRPLCATNPDVPGLCCLSPEAGRMWLARARKDGRAIDRELERQEAQRTDGTARPALTHDDKRHVRSPDAQPEPAAARPSAPAEPEYRR